MKKFLVALVVLALAACTTAQQQTAADAIAKAKVQIANACLVVQPTLVNLQAGLSASPAAQQALIATVVSDNAAFCAAASNVSAASAQSIISTTIPELIKAIALLPIPDADKLTIQIALGAASVALSNFLAVYGQPAAAPASAASA
ncbi:hypothetical protein [Caballeronia sp. NCTM1]|uniref:hypothetical protein n=1 Tax=Caballeronia sp. NCTM1 TaxID=2921753 RepID=UPI0020297086|nr:hypothetical protein [Caballeronia sp. NCTM1]